MAPSTTGSDSPAAERIVEHVRRLVESGQLAPGSRLPTERAFAQKLGVSRASVRTGIRSLVAVGVLRARQGSGTFVRDDGGQALGEPLGLMAALRGFTTEEMFEVRGLFEVGAAGLAARRAKGEQLATIADELAGMFASVEDPHAFLSHDKRFHEAVAEASGNTVLAALVETVSAAFWKQRQTTIDRARDLQQSAEMHRRVYRAIRSRSQDAARNAMSQHLHLAEASYAVERRGGGPLPLPAEAGPSTRPRAVKAATHRKRRSGRPSRE